MEGGRDIGKGGAASNVAEERCRGRGVQVLQRKGGERVRMGYGWVRRGSESRATRQGRGYGLTHHTDAFSVTKGGPQCPL